jgi:HAD superfamily phosphatase (TIGR01668 family)
MGLFKPNYYSKTIYNVPVSFFIKEKIKIIFSDLDNTLDAFYEKEPTDRAYKLVEELNKVGIELIITSNNHGERVFNYSNKLNVRCHHSSKKPLSYKLNKFIRQNNFKKDEILVVGDQLLTDILLAKGLKVKSLLVEPIVRKDLPVTKVNRFFDKIIRRCMKRKLTKLEVKNYE